MVDAEKTCLKVCDALVGRIRIKIELNVSFLDVF